jgi:hypothetical protein
MREAPGNKSAGLAVAAAAAVAVLFLIGVGGYAFLQHTTGVDQQTELKREEERSAAEAEANRKVEQAEQQRLSSLQAERERQARAAAEAEAKRKSEAEREREAPKAAQESEAKGASEAEARRKAEERAASPAEVALPQFPWPPPASSAFYVLPDNWFESRHTVGEVAGAIISALERNGYVERSFFRIERGGVALVTRLERISDDGSSFVEPQRWPRDSQNYTNTNDLIRFLRGLFFIDPGHYRVIVFILRDLPFSQSSQPITREDARAWLRSGANTLPPETAKELFGGGHCTVLVYEFASDGKAVRVVESNLTGKQHLIKAGLLSLLEKN